MSGVVLNEEGLGSKNRVRQVYSGGKIRVSQFYSIVNILQAYRKIDVTWERISRTFELREIHLSFQTGFDLVSAAVVCAILGEYLRRRTLVRFN